MNTFFRNSIHTTRTVLVILAMLLVAIPLVASANTAVIVDVSSKNVQPGQQISVPVKLNSSPETIYTSKLVLTYPSNLLEFKSFTYAPTWVAITMSDTDSVDTVNGKITKTAGYPNGTTGSVSFGTAVFAAKANGSAKIAVNGETQILDVNGKNVYLNTSPSVTVTVAPAPAPAPVAATPPPAKPVVVKKPKPVIAPIVVSATTTEIAEASSTDTIASSTENIETVVEDVTPEPQTAAVVDANPSNNGWILTVIVILLIVCLLIWYIGKKPKN